MFALEQNENKRKNFKLFDLIGIIENCGRGIN